MKKQEKLWGVYQTGMDECMAAISEEHAKRWAWDLNEFVITRVKFTENMPFVQASAVEWDSSEQAHKESLTYFYEQERKHDKRFDEGFHCDIRQPYTMQQSLQQCMIDAKNAIDECKKIKG